MAQLLLLEDDFDMIEMLNCILSHWHHSTILVHSNDDIISTLIETQPDGIIFDISIYNYHLIDLCRQIKSNEAIKHIPILVTSVLNIDSVHLANSKCDRYLQKPFELHVFRNCLADLLNNPAIQLSEHKEPEVCKD
jgi:DNA-binding response OmpR family regulator